MNMEKSIERASKRFRTDSDGEFKSGDLAAYQRVRRSQERMARRAAKDEVKKAKESEPKPQQKPVAWGLETKVEEATKVESPRSDTPPSREAPQAGRFSIPPPPTSGKYVLGCDGGGYVWMETQAC